jgi:hypothetical protein
VVLLLAEPLLWFSRVHFGRNCNNLLQASDVICAALLLSCLSLTAASRYAQLSKTISDHKDEIKLLKDKEKDLRDTIRNLDKDILVRDSLHRWHRPIACRASSAPLTSGHHEPCFLPLASPFHHLSRVLYSCKCLHPPPQCALGWGP